tara:strand:- start:243 stop:1325 length:1083 start_codon:yes stop_codon:yes gene_type:complete
LKNKISFFVAVITLSVIFNLLTQSSSEAASVGCLKNSDGSAIMVTPGATPFALAGTSTYNQDQCSQEPDQYKIKFYKVALCSADPYIGNADPDFTSCTDILSSEREVTLEPNVDTNLLAGGDLTLPIGSYPYLTVIVNNHLNIKHKQKYVLASDGSSAASIFGNSSGSGAWCWSREAVTTYANRIADGSAGNYATSYNTAHGVTLVESGTGTTNARLKCGSSEPSASDIQWATEIIDDLADDPDNDPFAAHTGGYFSAETDTGITGVDLAANLLKTDNTSIAANANEARRISATFRYASPVKISENTSDFKLAISTFSSVSIDMAIDTSDNNKIWAAKMGADPFTIQVKTKTKRARGSWR